ncbi:hypothetical protein ACFWAP_31215 [Streptomyces goshikiensis]|uniref:hypothetical protein n=1 Tax=Streptomyces goshikiensis TaxID=1942 RepID=UPI00365511D4
MLPACDHRSQWRTGRDDQRRGGPGLLDSYDTERRPAADAVAGLSIRPARIGLYSARHQTLARDTVCRLGSTPRMPEKVLQRR